jgi:hypothetical protein
VAFSLTELRKHHLAVKKQASIVDDLRAPFDDDQKKTQKDGKRKFTTVGHQHFIARLLDVVPGAYSVHRGTPVILTHDGAAAVAIATHITIEVEDGVDRVYGDVGASGVTDSKEDKDLANAIKAASSDSLKRALLPAGVNLDSYDGEAYVETEEEEEDEKPAPRRGRKPVKEEPEDEEEEAPAPKRKTSKSSSKWDGSEDCFGKFKDVTFADADGSWLAYCAKTFDEGANLTKVEKEIARRKDEDIWDPKEGDKPSSGGKRRPSGRTGRGGDY